MCKKRGRVWGGCGWVLINIECHIISTITKVLKTLDIPKVKWFAKGLLKNNKSRSGFSAETIISILFFVMH